MADETKKQDGQQEAQLQPGGQAPPAGAAQPGRQAESTEQGEQSASGEQDRQLESTESIESTEPAKPELPDFQVAVEDSGVLKKKITVTVPRARIDAKFNEMFGELGEHAQVPGFRVGHAPRRLVEKRFGREIADDVRNAMVGESLGEAMKSPSFSILGEPEIKLEDIKLPDAGDLAYSFEVEVAPEFELPEYQGIEIQRPPATVSEPQVEQALAGYGRRYGVLKPTTDGIQPGDEIVADVKLTGEGIAHARANAELRVAPAQFEGIILEDLPKALTGTRAGEPVTMKTKVPAGHPNADWRNKDVEVTLEIKEVKRLELPKLDEAFARQAGYDSLAELREAVRRGLQQQATRAQREAMHEQVARFLMENTKFDLPEGVAARHTARVMSRRYVDLLYRGVPREQIEQNLQQLEEAAAHQAVVELKLEFVLGKVVQREKIEVADDEVNGLISRMAAQQGRRPERLRQEMEQEGRLDELKARLLEEKAVEKILAAARIVDAAPADAPAPSADEDAGPDST